MGRRLTKLLLKLIKGSGYIYLHYNIKEARKLGVTVGDSCRFIETSPDSFSTEPYLIKIGNHVSMTSPRFITHDGGVWVFRNKYPTIDLFGKITIGDNVFIGLNAIILPDTEVGDSSIIAAGAVVKGKFEPNSVIAGVPARRISSVDDYFKKNENRFSYIKNLSFEDKKSFLIKNIL